MNTTIALIAQKGEETSLDECPVGLFLTDNNTLCFKSEYRLNGRVEAYIVSSGEAFYGGFVSNTDVNSVRVKPLKVEE